MNLSCFDPGSRRSLRSTRFTFVLLALCGALLAGCAAPPATPAGLMDVTARPAEKTLLAAIRAYDDARYPQSERLFDQALQTGLVSPKDQAAAHKYLAFIYCTSARAAQCEAEFRAARAADPGFALNKAERGHPLWGPVYERSQQR